VLSRRSDEQDNRERRDQQRSIVNVTLKDSDIGKSLLERDSQQEGEQDLHPGQRHAELVQQLAQLAVTRCLRSSSPTVRRLRVSPRCQRILCSGGTRTSQQLIAG